MNYVELKEEITQQASNFHACAATFVDNERSLARSCAVTDIENI
jgi:hypothetical protein